MAERSDACARTNAAGVDLNRNYGYRWGERDEGSVVEEEPPGRRAFSERETQVVAEVARRVRPNAYISVHSGAEAVLVPWDSGENVGGALLHMGREVGRSHCGGCAVGSAGEVFGYRAFGTAVDYMYGVVGVGVVMTVEIYGGREEEGCEQMFNPRIGEVGGVLRRWEGILETVVGLGVGEGRGWNVLREGLEEEENGVWFVRERGEGWVKEVWWMWVGWIVGIGIGVIAWTWGEKKRKRGTRGRGIA